MFTLEGFIRGLENVLPEIKTEVDSHKLSILLKDASDEEEYLGEINISEIQDRMEGMLDEVKFHDQILYNNKMFEAPVKFHDSVKYFNLRLLTKEGKLIIENQYKFEVTLASTDYFIALMCFCSGGSDFNLTLLPIKYLIRHGGLIETIDDLVKHFRIFTTKIVSPVECSMSEFRKMAHSYLFNITYNTDIVLTITNFKEEYSPIRRSMKRNGQLFPHKAYNSELVKYYNQGTSADIPFTQYLAFYHVAEYYFQIIAENEALFEMERFITRPSFSPYRKDDIKQFYQNIKKIMREQRDDGVWDEKTGLLLCLKKYVPNLDDLKNSVNSIDRLSVEYYNNHDVPFSDNGARIDFDEIEEKVYKAIRNRVYSIRNAIVHSKDGEKLRYEPYKHDKDLAKEIPLIRAIAEEIIINSAKALEIKFNE